MDRRETFQRLHVALLARKKELKRQLSQGLDSIRHNGSPTTAGDLLDETLNQGSALNMMAVQDRELNRINHALQRWADGNYGICEVCGIGIPRARLEALPDATLCIKCQKEAERRHETVQTSVFNGKDFREDADEEIVTRVSYDL